MTTTIGTSQANTLLAASYQKQAVISSVEVAGDRSTTVQVSSTTDTVSFSAAALSALNASQSTTASASSSTSSQTSYYEQFFPTRPGTNASALANAVTNPGAQSMSAGLTPAGIAEAARASMDAEYSAMAASGKPYDPNSKDGVDQDTLMSGLDRTALAAVSQNEGGLFTADEQNQAQSLMESQEGLATGYYAGPIDEKSKYVDPYDGDDAAKTKAIVGYMDKASSYEQSTISWAMSRASAQVGYEWTMEGRGETPDNLDSSNPLANLLARAMQTMSETGRNSNNPQASTKADLLAEPWMQGFESELDVALNAAGNSSGAAVAQS